MGYFIILLVIILLFFFLIFYFYTLQINTLNQIFQMLSLSDDNCSFQITDTDIKNIINLIKYPIINVNSINSGDFDGVYSFLLCLLLIFVTPDNNDSIPSQIITYKDFYYIDHPIIRVHIDNKNYCWIILRGTSSQNEIKQEIKLDQEEYYNVLVHKGFKYILSQVEDDIIEYISHYNLKCIFGIGHSMGGALLSILTQRLNSLYTIPKYLITIGAPRSGMYENSSNSDNLTFINIINDMDLIPFIIPPLIHLESNGITYSYNFYNNKKTISFNYNCVSNNHSIYGYYSNKNKIIINNI